MGFSIEPKSVSSANSPLPLPGAQLTNQVSPREAAIQKLMTLSEAPSPEGQATNSLVTKPEGQATNSLVTKSIQNTTNEATNTPASPPSAEAPAEKPLSSEYAVLARKEKALRLRDAQIRAKEAQLKAAEDARNAPKAPAFDESKYISREKLDKDLFGTLAELGLTYDQITQQAINAPTPEKVALDQELKTLRDEIKALRGETESTKKTWEQHQTDSYNQAVSQIKSEATSLITHNPNFETIKETNSVDDVVELIERTFKEDGLLLSVEDAAAQVEDYLVDEAMKIARIKKIQQRLQPAAPRAQAASPQKTTDSKQPQMKTLTNNVSTSRPLSAKERALLVARGEMSPSWKRAS